MGKREKEAKHIAELIECRGLTGLRSEMRKFMERNVNKRVKTINEMQGLSSFVMIHQQYDYGWKDRKVQYKNLIGEGVKCALGKIEENMQEWEVLKELYERVREDKKILLLSGGHDQKRSIRKGLWAISGKNFKGETMEVNGIRDEKLYTWKGTGVAEGEVKKKLMKVVMDRMIKLKKELTVLRKESVCKDAFFFVPTKQRKTTEISFGGMMVDEVKVDNDWNLQWVNEEAMDKAKACLTGYDTWQVKQEEWEKRCCKIDAVSTDKVAAWQRDTKVKPQLASCFKVPAPNDNPQKHSDNSTYGRESLIK